MALNLLFHALSYLCLLHCSGSPWYNHTGWPGVKHQLTYLLTVLDTVWICPLCLYAEIYFWHAAAVTNRYSLRRSSVCCDQLSEHAGVFFSSGTQLSSFQFEAVFIAWRVCSLKDQAHVIVNNPYVSWDSSGTWWWRWWWWLLLCSAILRSRADSVHSHVILHEWLAFYGMFCEYPPKWCTYSTGMAGATWNCSHLGASSVYTIQPCTMSLHAKPHT